MLSHEDIRKIRQQDTRNVYLAALVATLLHYVLIMYIRLPNNPPRVFEIRPPSHLVQIQRYTPPASAAAPAASAPAPLQPEASAAAADLPAGEAGPVRIGPEGTAPQALELATPAYPEEAKAAGIRGIVSLDVVVRRDGTVGDVTVRSGLSPAVNEAAIAAVRQSRFSPGQLGGQPVDALLTIDFRFQ